MDGGGGGGGGYQPTYHQWEPGRVRPKRPVTDYGSTMAHWMRARKPLYKHRLYMEMERPSASYIQDMVPPLGRPGSAADSLPVKHLHSSLNKAKFPVNVVIWTPDGRRLLTASSSGEFTVWNGMGFNFETIMQAHDYAVRSASYSHDGQWLVSSDQEGFIKYFTPNFNNVKVIEKAHIGGVKGLAFAPTDAKFVTGGEDASLKIFDFAAGTDEVTMTGHQWEVRCVDWHPHKGLVVSGSKDHSVKFWDPRTGRCLTTLSSSKKTVSRTIFEPTQGTYLATSGQDQIVRIFDIRMMRDVFHLRGHSNDITSLAWHPIHRNLVSSGGHGGAMHHYLLDEPNTPADKEVTLSPYDSSDPQNAQTQNIYPAHSIPHAHEPTGPIWALAWHPLGQILASGSNDRITRFWTRARPGDDVVFNDRYHIGQAAAEAQGTYDRRDNRRQMREEEEQEAQDEAEGLVDQQMPSKIPGLPGLAGTNDMALPGLGGAAPIAAMPPLAGAGALPAMFAGLDTSKIDMSRFAEMFGGQLPPFPPPGGQGGVPPPFPPPAGLPGMPLPPPHLFPGGLPPPGSFPAGFPPPLPLPGLPLPGMPVGGAGGFDMEGLGGGDAGIRRRGPLPSQQDSLREEMKKMRGGRR